jgi:7-keto-8-aminopelargonate synthetase-like enzyme
MFMGMLVSIKYQVGGAILAMQKLILGSLFCLSFVCVAGDSEKKAYRWIADDGSVMFSTAPPPPDAKAEEFELRDADTVIKQDKADRQRLLNQSESQTHRAQNRREQRKKIKQEIAVVKVELTEARKEIDEGKEPRPGETQHLAGGGTKLSPVYFKRLEKQEKKVEALEKRLDELDEELKKTF